MINTRPKCPYHPYHHTPPKLIHAGQATTPLTRPYHLYQPVSHPLIHPPTSINTNLIQQTLYHTPSDLRVSPDPAYGGACAPTHAHTHTREGAPA